jgi:hypothetical protein
VLVLIEAPEDGTKELLAVVDAYRESAQSWPAKCLEKDEEVLFPLTAFRPKTGRSCGPATPSNRPSSLFGSEPIVLVFGV